MDREARAEELFGELDRTYTEFLDSLYGGDSTPNLLLDLRAMQFALEKLIAFYES